METNVQRRLADVVAVPVETHVAGYIFDVGNHVAGAGAVAEELGKETVEDLEQHIVTHVDCGTAYFLVAVVLHLCRQHLYAVVEHGEAGDVVAAVINLQRAVHLHGGHEVAQRQVAHVEVVHTAVAAIAEADALLIAATVIAVVDAHQAACLGIPQPCLGGGVVAVDDAGDFAHRVVGAFAFVALIRRGGVVVGGCDVVLLACHHGNRCQGAQDHK